MFLEKDYYSNIQFQYQEARIHLCWSRNQGKLLGLLGIGDRLDSVKDQYNFYFAGDKHYLEYKEDSDKAGELVPIEIETNYRTAYSEEYNDQIIEGFLVYLLPEERGNLT